MNVGPDVDIKRGSLNNNFEIIAPYAFNSFETNDDITVRLRGISQKTIHFTQDFGLRLFLEEENGWLEIEKIITDMPDSTRHLYPDRGNPSDSIIVDFYPILPNPDKPAKIRVYFIGNVVEDNLVTSQKVGTYIDISLSNP